MRQPEDEVDLVFENFHAPDNLWDTSDDGGTISETVSNHFEAGGRVHGRVRLGEREVEVDGLGMRDHSCGPRDHSVFLSERWAAGTFGPELTFSLLTFHAVSGELVRTGFVVRDGVATAATDVDLLTYMEPDGFSHRGGRALVGLADGDELEFEFDLVDGMHWETHGVEAMEAICVARCGDLVGFADFEAVTNARNGRDPINLSIGAGMENGLSRRPESASRRGGISTATSPTRPSGWRCSRQESS